MRRQSCITEMICGCRFSFIIFVKVEKYMYFCIVKHYERKKVLTDLILTIKQRE